MGATGKLVKTGPTVTVRFERTVTASPEQVWAALTEPDQIESWLTQAEFEAAEGGKVHLVWPDDQGEMHGSVTKYDPHQQLEYSWNESSGASLLRFELAPTTGGSVLVLEHFGTSPEEAPGFGAGWQSHLEALDLVLAGTKSAAADRDARYKELRPAYDELLGPD
jgi:uncharacterized protein YndB with AHSA1/START domain